MLELLHSALSNVWSVFLVVFFFGGSIFVHELGHFLAARRRGVLVERFSIGFGPAICSWRGRHGTEYRIAWLPLGGYVLLPQLLELDQRPPALEGKSEADARLLPPVGYASKMIVFTAGVFFNVLFAFFLATILWCTGQPETDGSATTRIGYVLPELAETPHQPSPAAEAGLRAGDVIRAVDGRAVKDWNEMQQALALGANRGTDGRPRAVFSVERGGRLLELQVHPRLAGDNRTRMVGIAPDNEVDVYQVEARSPAASAGFKPGDAILSLDGVPIRSEGIYWDYLEAHKAAPVAVAVRRGGQPLGLTLPARSAAKSGADVGLAVGPATLIAHVSPLKQLADQVMVTLRVFSSILNPRSDVGLASVASGPIGIVRIFHSAAMTGIAPVLMITVAVNMSLALFNLLPIPMLDGGQILFATLARIRGRALPLNLIASLQVASIALVVTLFVYLSYFDIRRWTRDVQAEHSAEVTKP